MFLIFLLLIVLLSAGVAVGLVYWEITTNLPPVPVWVAICASVIFMVFVSGRFVPAMALVISSVQPRLRLGDLLNAGVSLSGVPPSREALGALLALGSEYRVGLQNFYVITRYNRSAYYATAVADLAEALAAAAK